MIVGTGPLPETLSDCAVPQGHEDVWHALKTWLHDDLMQVDRQIEDQLTSNAPLLFMLSAVFCRCRAALSEVFKWISVSRIENWLAHRRKNKNLCLYFSFVPILLCAHPMYLRYKGWAQRKKNKKLMFIFFSFVPILFALCALGHKGWAQRKKNKNTCLYFFLCAHFSLCPLYVP